MLFAVSLLPDTGWYKPNLAVHRRQGLIRSPTGLNGTNIQYLYVTELSFENVISDAGLCSFPVAKNVIHSNFPV